MNRTHLFRPLTALALLAWVPLLPAAEPAKDTPPADTKPADAPKPAPAAADGKKSPEATAVVVLPTVQVTAGRIKELDKAIEKLDQLIAREKKNVRPGGLDRTLNNQKLATAAAIFGGNSSEHLSAMAASRVSLMEAERSVLEDMKRPATPEDLAALEKELDQLRVTRRELDNVNR